MSDASMKPQAAARKPILGICAMDSKSQSTPMKEILSRINKNDDFEIKIFGNRCILDTPVEIWPNCNFLISFYSNGFPLEKAESYCRLRNPWCVNDIPCQSLLFSRQKIYEILQDWDIPVPTTLCIEYDENGFPACDVVETEDFIEVNGNRLEKPFVEKPADADDHNVFIYYPRSMGGGCRKLFRKTANESSQYFPDINCVRRGAGECYLYEQFLPVQDSQDVKVYTVGEHYTFAEKRKSPAVDGVVDREASGKEKRIVTELTPQEKDIARRVCSAFRQTVCGFDLLRTKSGPIVCDVNGWSFVKKCPTYYDACGQILRNWCLVRVGSRPPLSSRAISDFIVIPESPKKRETTRTGASPSTPVFGQHRAENASPKFKRHKSPYGGEEALAMQSEENGVQFCAEDPIDANPPTPGPKMNRTDSKLLLDQFLEEGDTPGDRMFFDQQTTEHSEHTEHRNTGYRDSVVGH